MKVLLIRNNIKKPIKIERGLEWFEKNTPIKFEFDEIETNFELTFTETGNGKVKGVIPKSTSLFPQLRKVVPDNKYDVVCVFIGNEVNGIRVSNAYKSKLYQNTRVLQTYKYNDGGLTWNHEFIHILFMLLADKNIIVEDPMDVVIVNGKVKHYFNNKTLSAKVSNRTIALERLAPHWDKLCLTK